MEIFSKMFIAFLAVVLVFSNFSLNSFAENRDVNLPDPSDLEWKSITFGQSTDLNFSANVLPEKVGVNFADPEFPGTIDGKIFMESRGGKLAPGHDGLTFYYTTLDPNKHNFVLEADITFEQLGPETGANPNGQEGAGIMVRDLNGGARQDPMIMGFEEVPAASNLFAVGLMRHGISALARTGVVEPWGNLGSTWNRDAIPGVPSLPMGTPVRLKLERTDSEFIMSATFTHLEDSPTYERSFAGADMVQVIDPNQMQVGFYASRNAAMTVENARITLSEADTVPTPVTPPSPPAAFMNIVSSADSGAHDYELRALANYDGAYSVWKDEVQVVTDKAVGANEAFTYNAALANDTTTFKVEYTPIGAPSSNKITREITVNKRIFNSGEGLFVSP
ncbi:hypothetical protein J2S74_002158 [Evansella vedderi]|uniref:Uncharacterized protein n=1 Tax=Evansella vedderi TaxID=38282 RepID=A0ABT9ZU92_9BACI|nr:hypothetical protein [Evansella vedderi]MDQ0254779.1 hypothetical protein [Evansella vedderi]